STTDYLYFSPYNRLYTTYTPSLTCAKNDAFTVNETSNGNGDLTYPVGLLTSDEVMLAGSKGSSANSTYYLYTNQYYWAGSPGFFSSYYAYEFIVSSTGALSNYYVYNANGVRPSVSLKPGTVLTGGDGTSTSPYTVE
ncbi:MAG: hypothetical protein IKI04_01715, partial [Bacilli bacterium]|nr:hypothetical protein [Bacilli bacterium]